MEIAESNIIYMKLLKINYSSYPTMAQVVSYDEHLNIFGKIFLLKKEGKMYTIIKNKILIAIQCGGLNRSVYSPWILSLKRQKK